MQRPRKWWAKGKHFTVMTSTGPLMLTEALKKCKHTICKLPSPKFMPIGIGELERGVTKVEGAAIKNLPGSSWTSWDTKFYNLILVNKNLTIFIAIVILILIICLIIYLIRKYMKRSREYKEILCNNLSSSDLAKNDIVCKR